MTLLDTVIVIVIVVIVGYLLYKPFAPMLKGLWKVLGNLWGRAKGENISHQIKTIQYD